MKKNCARRRWTEDLAKSLLNEIAFCAGNITMACDNLGVAASSFYKYLKKEKEDPVTNVLKAGLSEALAQGLEKLVDEARRRAFNGVNEPIVFQGQISYRVDPVTTEIVPVTIKKYSDRLLMFLITGLDTRFSKKLQLTGKDEGPLALANIDLSKASSADLDKLISLGYKFAKTEDT